MKNQNQVQQFHSDEFGDIGILLLDGKPYFPATECARILGYNQPEHAVRRHCVGDGCTKRTVIDRLGRGQEKAFISEGNLYRLIIRSKLPAAQRFEKWLVDTVLPSIREFGAYIAPDTLEKMVTSREFTIALLTELQKERDKNAELIPKANYCEKILQCKNALPITLIARDYGFSALSFNRLLHDLHVQYSVAGCWVLYQEYAKNGYTVTNTYRFGDAVAVHHTCWTQKGRYFLYEFLKNFGIVPMVEKWADDCGLNGDDDYGFEDDPAEISS